MSRPLFIGIAGFVLWGCSQQEPAKRQESDTTRVEERSAAPANFINRVWIVAESDHVEPGEVRVFLSDGTLVMTSPHGTPAFGTWRNKDGHLTITEESQSYDVDILELTQNTFRIRIHSPGEPVDIRFVPAKP